MAGLPAALTRRSVLATLPGVVLAPLAAGGMLRARPAKPAGRPASAKTLPEAIGRLAMQLAAALCAVEDGRCFATVYPATYADPPVLFSEIATDTAENVSQALIDAVYDHCVAYAHLRRLSQETDAVVLGREPTSKEWRRLDMASDRERHLLMRLCARPASTDAERHAKASYLLALFDGDEPSGEHVMAILQAMLEPMPTRPGRSA